MTVKRFKIIDVFSDLENKECWKWEDLLGALDKIAVIVGYETELLGKEYCGSYEEDIEQLEKEYKELEKENEQLKQQLKELKEDVPLLLAFYRWYPFAVEKKEHQAYNRLWDFVND